MALVEEMRSLTEDIISSFEGRVRAIGEIKGETTHFLSQAHEARETLGRDLRTSLAQGLSHLQSEVGATLHGLGEARSVIAQGLRQSLAQEAAQLISEVEAMLRKFQVEQGPVRQDIAGARSEWRKLSAATQSRKARPAQERAAPSSGMAGLGDRAFQYLANRPKGVRMTELEQALGAPRIQMAKALKGLVEANKVKKQDLLYFAA